MYQLEENTIEHKKIRDPIYGFILLPKEFLPIVDHKLFQRLRWVGQLPLEQLVFPSAQHSRFEHSLGVMHLSMIAATALVSNSKSSLMTALKEDDDFKKIKIKKDRINHFILSAGLAGLLHDVGHAPFSHTLESAHKYSAASPSYDHEDVGYKIACKILSEIGDNDGIKVCIDKALSVLNKDIDEASDELTPISIIIRRIISGPIDTDKGDYLIRDAYHCGVTYGMYDKEWLWRNIIIVGGAGEYRLGVKGKAAIQSWRLRMARYEMNRNVYQHHVRNITDSMLVDIITTSLSAIDSFENNNKRKNKKEANRLRRLVIPFADLDASKFDDDIEIAQFTFWTDDSLLRGLREVADGCGCKEVSSSIDNFLKRKLYKNVNCKFDIKERDGVAVFNGINEIKERLRKKQIIFSFFIDKETIPPVFEEEILGKEEEVIWVGEKNDAGTYLPVKLGKHLGIGPETLAKILRLNKKKFSSPEEQESEEAFKNIVNILEKGEINMAINRRSFLHIFPDKDSKKYIESIKQEVDKFLKTL